MSIARKLIEEYCRRFGEHIPLIRREDVKGFVHRKPVWMVRPLGIKMVRRQAEIIGDRDLRVSTSAPLVKSATCQRESCWETWRRRSENMCTLAEISNTIYVTPEVEAHGREKAHRRLFVLQIVQPGLRD